MREICGAGEPVEDELSILDRTATEAPPKVSFVFLLMRIGSFGCTWIIDGGKLLLKEDPRFEELLFRDIPMLLLMLLVPVILFPLRYVDGMS